MQVCTAGDKLEAEQDLSLQSQSSVSALSLSVLREEARTPQTLKKPSSLLGTSIHELSIFKRNEIRINSVPKLSLYFPRISLHDFLHESGPFRTGGDFIKVKSIWVKIKRLHI